MNRLLSDDRGFTIIEVLVSALLVVVVSLGVMSTFDATSRASDNARARAIAQDLAQQDQERLRGMTAAQLTSVPGGPQPKTVDNRTFQVTSTAVWDGDPDPNPDCGGDPVTTDYVRVTSMVSWGDIRVRPIVNRSLIAVPTNGTGGKVIVQVQNRDSLPLAGMTVSLSPGGVRSDATTSAKGCVAWDSVPAGDYTVTISKASGGYVDKNGRETYSQDITVIDNKAVSVGPITFDQAGTLVTRFQTTIGAYTYNNPTGTLAEALTDRLTATQAGMTQARRFGTPGSPQTSIKTWHDDAHPTSPGLFPFTGAYGLYAGDCSAEDPTTYSKPIPDTVTVARTDADRPVIVHLPPIDLTINANGSALNGANVYFQPTDPNCGTTPISMGVTGPDPANAARGGRLRFPGIPWGQYTICVDYDVNPPVTIPGYGTVSGWYTFTKPVSVTTATGPGAVTLDFYTAGAVQGQC